MDLRHDIVKQTFNNSLPAYHTDVPLQQRHYNVIEFLIANLVKGLGLGPKASESLDSPTTPACDFELSYCRLTLCRNFQIYPLRGEQFFEISLHE